MNGKDMEREAHEAGADAALLAALAELRQAKAPQRELWAGIEARIAAAAKTVACTPGGERTAALSALRVDQTPQRELWPAIELHIRVQRARRLRAPWLAAAGLAASLVVVLGLQVHRDAALTSNRAPLRASAEVVAALRYEPGNPALRAVSARPLAPETRALVRANLKIVNSAETQLKHALVADPDAVYLESLLATARQQKQDLRVVLAER